MPLFWKRDRLEDDIVLLRPRRARDAGRTLQSTSPCKNKGQSSALPPDVADLDWDGNTTEKVPYDLFGGQRKVSFVVDMGAYEIPLSGGTQ